MASRAVLSGEISSEGAIELLRDIELRRITGELRFESEDGAGSIALIGGEIAVDQDARDDGKDPVDVFLALPELRYEVFQRLPDLPVSRGTELEKRGSLAVHVPVDLMNYCEQAGLTGVLELSHEGRRAEATYDGGELTTIEVDGSEMADLQEVFGWEQGRFRIRFDPTVTSKHAEVPDEEDFESDETSSYSQKGEATSRFLTVVEMALTDVLKESEKARSPTRTSPPLPPPPKRRPRPKSVPPPPRPKRADQTVRLIYLTGDAEEGAPKISTRHAQKGGAEIAHIEARPERRAPSEESEPMAKKRKKKRPVKKKAAPEEAETKDESLAKAESKEPAAPEAHAPEEEGASADDGAQPDEAKPAGEKVTDEPTGPLAGPLGAVVWALAFFVLGIVLLAVLAQLPPLE